MHYKKILLLLIKFTISVGLLTLLIIKVEHQHLLTEFKKIPFLLLVSLASFILVAALIQGYRWQTILRSQHQTLSFRKTINIVMLSLFFNQTLPSTIGGDVLRVWKARQTGISTKNVVSSVFCDRFSALIAIIFLCIAGSPFLLTWLKDPTAKHTFMIFCMTLIACTSLFLALPILPKKLQKHFPFHLGVSLAESVWHLFKSSRNSFVIIASSLLIQSISIITIYCLGLHVHFGMSLFHCFILLPAVILLSMLPISIAGWGLREGIMIMGMHFFGVSMTKALTISVFFGAVMFLTGAFGALYWLLDGVHFRKQSHSMKTLNP